MKGKRKLPYIKNKAFYTILTMISWKINTAVEISKMLRKDQSVISRQLKQLVKDGLIYSNKKNRIQKCELTEKGEKILLFANEYFEYKEQSEEVLDKAKSEGCLI